MAAARKPPPPSARLSADKAEAFVRAGEGAKSPSASVTQETGGPSVRKLVPRAHGPALQRIAAYFPPELGKRLAVHCALTGAAMSDVIVTAVREWFERHGGESR